MKPIKVIIAEDNINVRKGMHGLLNRSKTIAVVAETGNGLEALQLVAQHRPDVLLLDVQLPGLNGLEIARRLASQPNCPRILVISAYDDPQFIGGMLAAGAAGYLLKDEAAVDLILAIHEIASGAPVWLSPMIAERLETMI